MRLLGIVLIIIGIFFVVADEDHLGATGEGISRASTQIKFGADFYTTSAQYTGLAANALTDLFDMVQNAFGVFFVFLGAADCCLVSYFSGKNVVIKEIAEESIAQ